jgi:negative regulator of genetic competence, sporulation and motility
LHKKKAVVETQKELTPEEKLQKIIDYIIENKSDYVSVSKLMDIISIESTFYKKQLKFYMPNKINKEFHESEEYKENYIS